jgi:hypothetical protein
MLSCTDMTHKYVSFSRRHTRDIAMPQKRACQGKFTVVIGNIGDVYQDTNEDFAMLAYDEWTRRSFCDPNSDAFGNAVQLYYEMKRVA